MNKKATVRKPHQSLYGTNFSFNKVLQQPKYFWFTIDGKKIDQ